MKKITLVAAAILFSTGAMAAGLAPECEAYFKATDAMFDESTKTAGLSAADIKTAKEQYEMSKTQMAQIPQEQQVATCKQALEAVEQMKKAQQQ